MSFKVVRFKERNLKRRFWSFRSLLNPYDEFFSQK